VARVSREEILNPKFHVKSDSHDFLGELYQFVYEEPVFVGLRRDKNPRDVVKEHSGETK
jgi:hypothetical protein